MPIAYPDVPIRVQKTFPVTNSTAKALRKISHSLYFLALLLFTFHKAAAIPDSLFIDAIGKGIRYLTTHQVKQNHDSIGLMGEWASYVKNDFKIPFLGKKGKSAYDSNGFNTLFIFNILAEMHERSANPSIPPLLELALKNTVHYQNGNTFNFWPLLPKVDHECKKKDCKQRGPRHFHHHYRIIRKYANVYDDADDTSAGVLAYYYAHKFKIQSDHPTDANYYKSFEKYRDTGKRKTNWYNKRLGFKKRTGAYLTWFGADRKPSGFFSWFFPSKHSQNILYGRNEIDCIVNANILRTLYIKGDTNIAGVNDSKNFIRKVIEKNKCFSCGVYYPTEFSFHYSVAKAISAGVTGLGDVVPVLKYQLKSALKNGHVSFTEIGGNELQATLYAVNALMYLDQSEETMSMLKPAMEYIYLNMIGEGDEAHWLGGVFFSGGSAVRYLHVWRSDEFTTALALEAMSNYLRAQSKS